ncbi:MAG: hypothetical protein GY854_25180 [Deltaproteobacteria bacterium]|nr:hypothetical protein [Deltaproteobacteria bacterium]
MKKNPIFDLVLMLVWIFVAGCGTPASNGSEKSTSGSTPTARSTASVKKKRLKRVLPDSVKLYWANPITKYSLSSEPGTFSHAKGYPKQVSLFDEALPAKKKDSVKHMRDLDAIALTYIHYFEHYAGRPPTPLVWWLKYKLGDPSWGGKHVEHTARGTEAEAELDEALKKAASEIDIKDGIWGYGVAREEYGNGRFRQVVVFAEKRLLLEDFPKKYEKGSTFKLKGSIPGKHRDLNLTMSIDGDYFLLDKKFDIDKDGKFAIEVPFPKKKGVVKVTIARDDPKMDIDGGQLFLDIIAGDEPKKDIHGGRLFLDIYVGVPEPSVPGNNKLFWEGIGAPSRLKCPNFKPQTQPTNKTSLPELPTYDQVRAALLPAREKIKRCKGDEGDEVVMVLMIDGSGQIKSAGTWGDRNYQPVIQCIVRALCDAKFPEFEPGTLMLKRRFVF